MDKQYMRKTIEHDILPHLDEFLKADSALFLYIEYEDRHTGVRSLVIPYPPQDNLEQVMHEVATEIYDHTHQLPALVMVCEKVKYASSDDESWTIGSGLSLPDEITLPSEGISIMAVEASTADGFVNLYSLPDLKELGSRDIDKDSEDAPPYMMLATAYFMKHTLQAAGLVKEDEEEEEDKHVKFRFSRN